jgi:hypothetical protein
MATLSARPAGAGARRDPAGGIMANKPQDLWYVRMASRNIKLMDNPNETIIGGPKAGAGSKKSEKNPASARFSRASEVRSKTRLSQGSTDTNSDICRP